jgi:uncharacterized damage-inducible protein DinB
MTTTEPLASAVTAAAAQELTEALDRIRHCLDQLTDEQIWHRPGAGQNSIANLLLHLSGNLRQWIVVGLGGGEDRRNRPAEFADESGRPKQEVLAELERTVQEACQALSRQSTAELTRVRRIQGREVSGLTAIFNSIPHFRGHAQEIVFRTRLLLGTGYKFATPLPP